MYVNRYVDILVCIYIYSYSFFTPYFPDLEAVYTTMHEEPGTFSSGY